MLLFILLIFTFCVFLTESSPVYELKKSGKGLTENIDYLIQEYLMGSLNTSIILQKEDISYYLYTKELNGTFINQSTILSINFDTRKETIFIIHGWKTLHSSKMPQMVKDAYLASRDVNIIIVDWSILSYETYITSKSYVPQIGKIVADFILFMNRYVRLRIEKTAFVGFSLGAHIAGNTGRMIGGSASHLVGLDPAGPLYYITNDQERLSVGDAQFVQVIHTCGGMEGFNGPIGNADYWPNGGVPNQPGCEKDLTGTCSHSRAYGLYSESLRTGGFLSLNCSSFSEYSSGSCDANAYAYMGNDAIDRSTGNFYLSTNSQPPYSET